MDKQCEICDKPFKIKPSSVKRRRGRFCSRVCSSIWKREAYQGEKNPKWRGGYLNCECATCGVNFESSDGQAVYCQKHRLAAVSGERNCNWTGGKLPIELLCACCGKSFVCTVSQARSGRKFCKQSCSNITKNKSNKKNGTALELAVQRGLESLNISFQTQVPLYGIALVDFLAGTAVIQCDGVYWHTLPGRAEHDARQDVALNALGYAVIRISDEEIKNTPVTEILKRKAWIATAHAKRRVTWQ